MNEYVTETPCEGVSFWDRVRKFFHREEYELEPQYHRRLLDGRIERFLDENFDDYVAEYGLVTKMDIEGYETRYKTLENKVNSFENFTLDMDAKFTDMERRVKKIQTKKQKK